MTRSKIGRMALAGSALTAIWAMPAMAQDSQGGEDEASGNDIIVTARRVEERLQDVPISITVYNQEAIASRNITNAADLATYTPSLSVNTRYGPEKAAFAIRGFVQDFATAPSVGVYFADVVGPRGSSTTTAGNGVTVGNLFDLQNVQVLKGPQGTLFGRNTTGGAVLLVPNRPTGKLEGYIEGSAGNYDMWRVQGVVNVPFSETFKVRLGVDHMKRQGYLNNKSPVGPRDFNNTDYISARLSILAELAPNLENYTIGSYTNSDNNGTTFKVLACRRPNPALPGNGSVRPAVPGRHQRLRPDRPAESARRRLVGYREFPPQSAHPFHHLAGDQHHQMGRHRQPYRQEHLLLFAVQGRYGSSARRRLLGGAGRPADLLVDPDQHDQGLPLRQPVRPDRRTAIHRHERQAELAGRRLHGNQQPDRLQFADRAAAAELHQPAEPMPKGLWIPDQPDILYPGRQSRPAVLPAALALVRHLRPGHLRADRPAEPDRRHPLYLGPPAALPVEHQHPVPRGQYADDLLFQHDQQSRIRADLARPSSSPTPTISTSAISNAVRSRARQPGCSTWSTRWFPT